MAFLHNPDHVDNELQEAERAAAALGVTLKNTFFGFLAGVSSGFVLGLVLGIVALVKVSGANKRLDDHDPKIAKIDAIELAITTDLFDDLDTGWGSAFNQIGRIPQNAAIEMTRKLMQQHPDADTVLLPSPHWPCAVAIDAIDPGAVSARARGRDLLNYTHEKGADLLVMGAYGRGQVLSFLGLDGATAKVISSCRVPLLLAH